MPRFVTITNLLFGFFLVITGTIRANAAPSALDISTLNHQTLRAPVEYRVSDTDATLRDIRTQSFTPLTDDQINRGISTEPYWLRVRLTNSNPETAKHWVLHHETSYLDNLQAYLSDNGDPIQEIRLSDRKPFNERPVTYRKLAIRHVTPASGYTDLYLRLQHDVPDSITLNMHLWDRQVFQDEIYTENLLLGAYFGSMLIFMIIALFCASFLRQALYVHYALFLVFSMLLWGSLNGLTFQYLWPNSPLIYNNGFHVIYLLVAIFALQFSRRFLKIPTLFPRLNKLLYMLQAVMVAGIAMRLFGLYVPVLALSYGSLCLLGLLPILGLMAWRKGVIYARWYAAAWLVYAVGLTLSVVSAFSNLLSWGMEPLLYTQMASLVEALFLLVALGDRLMSWERDRKHALQIANYDPLTGLGNRRRLEQAFNAFSERFEIDQSPVFIAIMDLDDFKQINDSYGHDAGDEVLRDVAQLLKRHTRTEDVCIRYGGEEFAMLLQAPSLEDALQITERIRSEFAEKPTRYRAITLQHTLSAGLTTVLSKTIQLTADEMVRRADEALYQAKHHGKNRTTVFQRDLSENTLKHDIHDVVETSH